MDIQSVISAVIGLISLIVFFFMADNISTIKKEIQSLPLHQYRVDYYKYLAIGDKEKTYQALLSVLFSQLMNTEIVKRKSKYNELKVTHEVKFNDLGFTFPDYPF